MVHTLRDEGIPLCFHLPIIYARANDAVITHSQETVNSQGFEGKIHKIFDDIANISSQRFLFVSHCFPLNINTEIKVAMKSSTECNVRHICH